jgi:putative hemolysin
VVEVDCPLCRIDKNQPQQGTKLPKGLQPAFHRVGLRVCGGIDRLCTGTDHLMVVPVGDLAARLANQM